MITSESIKTNTTFQTKKVLLWVSLGSIVMIFAALTSGYIVRQAEGNWVKFNMPRQFYLSTAIIILSSVSMNSAISSIKKNLNDRATLFLAITLALGASFVVTQYLGWIALVQGGIHFVGNPSGSFFYVLTGLHIAHLLAGLLALIVTLVMSMQKKYKPSSCLGMQLCATYWHFLGGLWVYLFFFLLLIR